MEEIKLKIRDNRIGVLLEYSKDTPFPMNPEEVIEDALEKYFSRRDVKARL